MTPRARRQTRRGGDRSGASPSRPPRAVRYPFAPIDLMSAEAVARIDGAALTVLEEVGLRVDDAEARGVLKAAGCDVDESDARVRIGREVVRAYITLAPSKAMVRGRSGAPPVTMGAEQFAIAGLGGPAFVSDMDRGRRAGTFADLEDALKLTHMLDVIDIGPGAMVAPNDLPVPVRHLEFFRSAFRITDKPWKPQGPGRTVAEDALAMAEIAYGETREELAANPVFLINTNANTPLVFDAEICQSMLVWAAAGQPICVTPFALAGAMAPATVAGAVTIQTAETLAACVLVQAVRPGCPYLYGSFASNVDMRTGSPAFGTPEYAQAQHLSGQMARHYNLPWRSSNVTASPAADAQAAYESMMSLWGAVTSGCQLINHAAGWLEGGLVCSFEKLVMDAEMLQMLRAMLDPVDVSDAAIGLDAIREVGPAGHFFGAAHTLERYETAFYAPMLSDWRNFEAWQEAGSQDATARASTIWKDLLARYEAPPMDDAVADALDDFVARRSEALMS